MKPTSTRRSCLSSRCSARKADPRSGQALVLALLLLLFVLPAGITLYKLVSQSVRASVSESHQKTALGYANSAIMDYMRQFSQDPYSGHYDAASLARNNYLYQNGFSTVTYVPDAVNHNLYLRAEGNFTSPGVPTRRAISAVIHFQSPLTKYGTMINGPFTISGSHVTYEGGMWINGALGVTGSNVTWNGGPLIVNGSVTGASGAVLNGSLFYSGAGTGSLAVNGSKYNFVPSASWPTIDTNFYYANSTYISTTTQSIVFNSTGSFTVVGGASYGIPATGAILYCSACNFTLSGVVSGRVTAVAAGSSGSGAQGNITVKNGLYYAGASSMSATAANSFAAMASNTIAFTRASGNMLATGTYFVQNGTTNMRATGAAGATFWLNGVRTQGMSVSGFNGGFTLSYDANLVAYPPPGLPETPMLVNYRVH
ncbi:MAG: hypothetical protein KGJ84_13535 [Elusimicrobia bacterium]|nr:hypothetical protein [Elusimicrobiota bacterium]